MVVDQFFQSDKAEGCRFIFRRTNIVEKTFVSWCWWYFACPPPCQGWANEAPPMMWESNMCQLANTRSKKHYIFINKWWQTVQKCIHQMLSPCQCVSGMKVKCFDGISFKILVAFLKKASTFDTLPHNRHCLLATHLLVCCPPLSPSLLPPPSLDAAAWCGLEAAARATGGGAEGSS